MRMSEDSSELLRAVERVQADCILRAMQCFVSEMDTSDTPSAAALVVAEQCKRMLTGLPAAKAFPMPRGRGDRLSRSLVKSLRLAGAVVALMRAGHKREKAIDLTAKRCRASFDTVEHAYKAYGRQVRESARAARLNRQGREMPD